MSIYLIFPLLLAATVALVVLIGAIGLHGARRSDHEGIRRVQRVTAGARIAAAVLAVGAVLSLTDVGAFGQGLALVPAVAAAVWVVGGVAAELVSASMLHDGGANLEVRTLRRYLPGRGTALLAGALLALLVTGVVTSAMADSTGRGLSFSCGPDCTSTRTPWPGSFYLLPVGIAFAVLLALTAIGVYLIVNRPRGGLGAVETAVDDGLRRTAVAAILAVVALAIAVTGMGLMVFGILGSTIDPDGPLGARLALVTVLLSIMLAVAATVALLLAALGRPAVTGSRGDGRPGSGASGAGASGVDLPSRA